MFRSSHCSVQRPHRTGVAFTLVELMVVMGVVSVLLVAALPAFKGLGRATSQRGAVGTMLGVIDRARMMAVSDGLPTYVVFACPAPGGGNSFKPDLLGTAYAIFEDHDNINFTPEQRTPWMKLPTNVALKINDNDGQHGSVTTQPLSDKDPVFAVTPAALIPGASASMQLPYWKFDSTGAVVNVQDAHYLRVLLFSGVISTTGTEIPTQTSSGGATKGDPLLSEIDVNTATGRAKFIVNALDNLATPTPTP